MTFAKFPRLMRMFSLVLVSFLIGFAMTRFVVSNSGMMPYRQEVFIVSALAAFGYHNPAPEDVTDTSILATLLTSWVVGFAFVFVAPRLMPSAIRSAMLKVIVTISAFCCAYFLAQWILDVVVARVQFKDEPDDLEVLYLPALLVACWLTVLAVVRALVLAIQRLCSRRPTTSP
jgi:hypothetical protein